MDSFTTKQMPMLQYTLMTSNHIRVCLFTTSRLVTVLVNTIVIRPTSTAWSPSGAGLKRGYHGTYHHMSPKHLGRYINEFAGRHNDRPSDTIDQMAHMVRAMEGKQLPYKELTAGGPAIPAEARIVDNSHQKGHLHVRGGLFDLHSCISQPRFGDYIHDPFACNIFSGLPKCITNMAPKRHNLIENCYRM